MAHRRRTGRCGAIHSSCRDAEFRSRVHLIEPQPSEQLFLVRPAPVVVASGTRGERSDVWLADAQFVQMLPNVHAQPRHHAVMLCSPLSRCVLSASAPQAHAPGRISVTRYNRRSHVPLIVNSLAGPVATTTARLGSTILFADASGHSHCHNA